MFVSYHSKDQDYRDAFDVLFGHLFINHSVKFGDIEDDLSTIYIKRLIRENHVSNASVVVVLVGPMTYGRKHVDWEISAGIGKTVGNCGYSGLMGLRLPNHPEFGQSHYTPRLVPARFHDNVVSGYAKLYDWTEAGALVASWVTEAFIRRTSVPEKRDNRRLQMLRNTF